MKGLARERRAAAKRLGKTCRERIARYPLNDPYWTTEEGRRWLLLARLLGIPLTPPG